MLQLLQKCAPTSELRFQLGVSRRPLQRAGVTRCVAPGNGRTQLLRRRVRPFAMRLRAQDCKRLNDLPSRVLIPPGSLESRHGLAQPTQGSWVRPVRLQAARRPAQNRGQSLRLRPRREGLIERLTEVLQFSDDLRERRRHDLMVASPAFSQLLELDLGLEPLHEVRYGFGRFAYTAAHAQVSDVARPLHHGGAARAPAPTAAVSQMLKQGLRISADMLNVGRRARANLVPVEPTRSLSLRLHELRGVVS